MNLLHPQVVAFITVLEESSFDNAAKKLSVTPSAISQRIKSLEDRLGQVLVLRQFPCRPTPAGEQLLRRVKPMQTLEAEAIDDFLPKNDKDKINIRHTVSIAVNDDSLATWFLSVQADLHHKYGYMFDLHVDDQDHTIDYLKNGRVMGAITSEEKPLQGCNTIYLGKMRYFSVASKCFIETYFNNGLDTDSLSNAPMIVFDRKDSLQWKFLNKITAREIKPPIHYIPTSSGFIDAAALGLGWCLAPEFLITKNSDVELLSEEYCIDIPLYWQYYSFRSEIIKKVTQELVSATSGKLYE